MVKKFPYLYLVPEDPLPYSQETITGRYSWTNQPSPHSHIVFLQVTSNLHLRLQSRLFSAGFSTKIPRTHINAFEFSATQLLIVRHNMAAY